MAGFEVLQQVREYNTAAVIEEQERRLAELGGSLDPKHRGDRLREGVPLELWRALKQ